MSLNQRIQDALERSGRSAREISLRANLGSTFLSELLRDPSRSPTVAKMEALAKALGVDPAWLITGAQPTSNAMTRSAAEPWTPPDPGGQRQDLAEGRRKLLRTLAPTAGNPAGYALTVSAFPFGLLAGDVLVIDLKAKAQEGDLVIATVADPQTGSAKTVLRRYLPPYLLSPDPEEEEPSLVVDGHRTVINGPVLASFRAPQLAA